MAGVATIIAKGSDDVLDLIHNPWGLSIRDRTAPLLTDAGYQVLDFQEKTSVSLTDILGGLTYPYQATIKLETATNPNTLTSVRDAVSAALMNATGYTPSAIAVTSAGQDAPSEPEPGIVDRIVNGINSLLGTALTGATLITAAIAIGIIALVYWIAKNPAKARRLV